VGMMPPPPKQDIRPRGRMLLSGKPRFEYLFQFMMVLVLSAMIRINNRLKQIEKEKVHAELSYLRAQINPHFLFNTLNSIYSSAIDENADNTASAVVMLSGMMRYVISESQHQYVPLENELSYISDYIELQKIRLGETVHLAYTVSGDPAGKQVAPLILISFIENAFKHGVNPEEDSRINIEIIISGHMLQLSVLNRKVNTVNGHAAENKVGLKNTSNRLNLLYPSKHQLLVKEDEKEYMVLLKINLQ
jgi:LytS/YehU family sensor histidine kinase